MITTRRLTRALRASMPKWLVAVFAVALAIPGPLDDAAVLIVAVGLCVLQPSRAHRALSAWRGGKSHRRADERTA
jgi:hypothetical protein